MVCRSRRCSDCPAAGRRRFSTVFSITRSRSLAVLSRPNCCTHHASQCRPFDHGEAPRVVEMLYHPRREIIRQTAHVACYGAIRVKILLTHHRDADLVVRDLQCLRCRQTQRRQHQCRKQSNHPYQQHAPDLASMGPGDPCGSPNIQRIGLLLLRTTHDIADTNGRILCIQLFDDLRVGHFGVDADHLDLADILSLEPSDFPVSGSISSSPAKNTSAPRPWRSRHPRRGL